MGAQNNLFTGEGLRAEREKRDKVSNLECPGFNCMIIFSLRRVCSYRCGILQMEPESGRR